jgi:hypothetical protein
LQQTDGVNKIHPAADADAARWLLQVDVPWQDLVTFGPPGFAVYVRVAFPREDVEEPSDTVRAALVTLASHTTTPDCGYAAIWEGWGGGPPTPQAPRVAIPNREMLLFTGPVEALRDSPALAWHGSAGSDVGPHLVWPEDHAWCLACDVDEEIEFNDAAEALSNALPGATRRVTYAEAVPTYRDEQ